MNILWICTDQQRFDTLGAWGNARIRTPHIDRLVREGLSLKRAYCQSTVCAPSRASFLTGRYPRTTGCRQNGQAIPARERLTSRLLADRGYRCGLAGKLHLASCANGRVETRTDDGYEVFHWSHHPQPDWPENAYTQWLAQHGKSWEELYSGPQTAYVKHGVPAEFHQTTWCAEMAVNFIEEMGNRPEPWLFSFNCFDPHHPFDPPPEYLAKYSPDDMSLPDYSPGELDSKPRYQQLDHEWAHNEEGGFHVAAMTDDDRRQVTAAYYAMIELIDDQVGRMVDALESTGQLDDTLIIFMSDHGEMLGDHGLYYKGPHFYEAAVHAPLVLRLPHVFPAGQSYDGLVELVDLAPTLMDLATGEVPEFMQGKSLLPLCEDLDQQHRDHIYCEYYNAWSHPRSYGTMMRTDQHKIVVYHGGDDDELYDLDSDLGERHNLWRSEEHAPLRERLLKQAFDASVFTMDPMPKRLGPF